MGDMASDDAIRTLQRQTAAAGAALLVLAFATGVLLGAVMTHKVSADVHEIVAAHLNAVLGSLWLFALAYTLPMLRFGELGTRRLVLATAVPAYMNWLVTTIKAFLHVSGVDVTGDRVNDAVFATLGVFVVGPSFGAAIAWTYGLLGPRRA
jgi:hydroxylaminobenzene mutase